jgi:hypothetical protein
MKTESVFVITLRATSMLDKLQTFRMIVPGLWDKFFVINTVNCRMARWYGLEIDNMDWLYFNHVSDFHLLGSFGLLCDKFTIWQSRFLLHDNHDRIFVSWRIWNSEYVPIFVFWEFRGAEKQNLLGTGIYSMMSKTSILRLEKTLNELKSVFRASQCRWSGDW